MAKKKDEHTGPIKGDFITSPIINDEDELADALPQQEEFWRPPVRFGSVPVEKEPLGWHSRKGFRKLFPAVYLPFQVVDRVPFGHPELEPNRLFWGDNLHIMRQLPSESIDLIYIDPPFFSGQEYNVIFGDQNELRSFSDIWEGGMPGYLIWLNARLYEMKRLLKKNGSIYVHCDDHASHYIKTEMDKIFGVDNFTNEIVWHYRSGGRASNFFSRKHDVLLWYTKTKNTNFYPDSIGVPRNVCPYCETILEKWNHLKKHVDEDGRIFRSIKSAGKIYKYYDDEPVTPPDVWVDVNHIQQKDPQRIGYPTQKPEALLERVIKASTQENDVVADFFCGGGTTPAVAQRLNRRWVAADQSRVAVAITADRMAKVVEQDIGKLFPAPDFTVEHWGVYEAHRLSKTPPEQFRAFVLRAFGAVEDEQDEAIHGYKGAIPVWVSAPDFNKRVSAKDVREFATAIGKSLRYKQDNLRDGIMLGWAFGTDAVEAAERLRQMEQTELNFVRLDMIRIDSPNFREHVASLSTSNADYANFLTFVQPPKIEVIFKRISERTYKFDISDTIVLNSGAKIINVQWDFDYGKRFSSTDKFSFVREGKEKVPYQVQYTFPKKGVTNVACKIQDDMGGEGLWSTTIEVK